ncbi:MAG: adenosine deaminase [Gammaproteobacteria bacterium TMED1]|nr:MAG: adenosine deaminase [Gammaproteobacteria bacterium TMED1]
MNKVEMSQIERIPKVELHVHLEGTLGIDRIRSLAQQAGQYPPKPFEELFQFSSLAEFLATLDWMFSLIRTEEQVREIARDFAVYARTQNLIYVEVTVNPSHWHLSFDTLFLTLQDEFDKACTKGGPDIRILPSIARSDSMQSAMELVQWCIGSQLPRIVGLSIDGDERLGSFNGRFAPAFALALEHGIPGTAHAGESSSASGVTEALSLLGVKRIDHGVRAIERSDLVTRLASQDVTLNICVSSNCSLLYPGIDHHPLKLLMESGVPCTLNTDDPAVMGISLNEELQKVSNYFGFDEAQIIKFQLTAIDAAFCQNSTQLELRERLHAGVSPANLAVLQ